MHKKYPFLLPKILTIVIVNDILTKNSNKCVVFYIFFYISLVKTDKNHAFIVKYCYIICKKTRHILLDGHYEL